MNAYRTSFDDRGYFVARHFFGKSEIAALEEQVDRIYGQWLVDNKSDTIEYNLINMHSLTSAKYFGDQSKRVQFFKTIAPKSLTDLMHEVFGSGIYFHNSQLFFNPHSSERLPYWHRDIQYNPIDEDTQRDAIGSMLSLHIRIPLVEETGVEVVPGTHRRWDTVLERNIRLEQDGHKNSEELPGAELIQMGLGDILIFSANMIHRGNYALNKSRKALDLCVGKQHTLTSCTIDHSVLPTDEEMPALTNNEWYRHARSLLARSKSELLDDQNVEPSG